MADDYDDFIPDFSSEDNPFDDLDGELQRLLEGDFDLDEASERPTTPLELDSMLAHGSVLADEPPTRPAVAVKLPSPPSETVWIEPLPVQDEPVALARFEGDRRRLRRQRAILGSLALVGLLLCLGSIVATIGLVSKGMFLPEVAALIPLGAFRSTSTVTPLFVVTLVGPSPTAESLAATASIDPMATDSVGVTQPPVASSTPPAELAPASIPTSTPAQSDGGNINQSAVQMIYVSGGTFAMGSTAHSSESPVHEVTLSPYYIDQYEVTNAGWAACVEAGGCQPPGAAYAFDGSPYYGVDSYRDYPVIYISWYNADAYCRWRGARLPTEAQWEMAARWNPATGQTTIYPWGDDWDRTRLNYCDSSCLLDDPAFVDSSFDDGWPQMAPVGTFPAGVSPVGAYDMAGNVAEWVADWYSADYYAVSPAADPIGPEEGISHVVRGGGWSLDRSWTRTTARSHFGGLSQVAGIGFRCAVSADQINP